MKRATLLLLVFFLPLCGCKPVPTAGQPVQTALATNAASGTPVSSANPSPIPVERTPNPAGEMLVAGTVTAVLEGAVRVRDDALGKELDITMLDRAVYADGVSRKFSVGNTVRIITSNRLAKTVPERAAARMILENK